MKELLKEELGNGCVGCGRAVGTQGATGKLSLRTVKISLTTAFDKSFKSFHVSLRILWKKHDWVITDN